MPPDLRVPTHSATRAALLRAVLGLLFRGLLRLEVEGGERIPLQGPCILVFNHLSNFDPHLLFTLVRRPDATGLVAAAYRKRPLARWLVEQGGGMWLRRGRGDREALATALALLDKGWLVGLSPEGGRSASASLSPAKGGAAFLHLRSGAPVLPVAVTGTENIHRRVRRLGRTPVRIRVGRPFHPHPGPAPGFRPRTRAVTSEIMRRIAELLPTEYRGVYAELHHPARERGEATP